MGMTENADCLARFARWPPARLITTFGESMSFLLSSTAGLNISVATPELAARTLAMHLSDSQQDLVQWHIASPDGDLSGSFDPAAAGGLAASVTDQVERAHAQMLRNAARAKLRPPD